MTPCKIGLKGVLEIFKNELLALERCTVDVPGRRSHEGGNTDFTTANLYGGSSNYKKSRNQRCVFCSESHSPSNCVNVTDVKSRVALLRKKGKCFLCLSSGHLVSDCKADYICRLCNKRHNIAICDQRFAGSKAGKGETSNAHACADAHETVCNQILLQTGGAEVYNAEDESYKAKARLLFDSGSQRSYITQSMTKYLNIRCLRKERLVIKTFGINDCCVQDIEVAQLKVKSSRGNGDIYLELLVVPEICSPLSSQLPKFVKLNYPHLRSLYLSDFVNCENGMNIDILIGTNFYYQFMTGKIIRGPTIHDPVALESVIGWILSGPYGRVSSQNAANNLVATHVMATENGKH